MPELQKIFDKYKDDKDVAILTIDSNDELLAVKKFMAEKNHYEFLKILSLVKTYQAILFLCFQT